MTGMQVACLDLATHATHPLAEVDGGQYIDVMALPGACVPKESLQ